MTETAVADGVHLYPVRVYFEDTDAGGIVYHANYLRFAERARTEALRAMGLPHSDMMLRHGMIFVVRHAELDYQRPARLDDSLVVETTTVSVGGASMKLRQRVKRNDETLVVVDVTLVSVAEGTGRAGRIPAAWRDALTAMARAREGAQAADNIGVS
ncbi:tol-pal system-associated acyl-CoA thioesterase [Acidisoma cellulosilytica]|uniref:Tol-pal system-associated acyl-CoA thioesterase n=1 Tax=Acidisoma cellulosilyticum TaxID=2802395 RepID=A0A963Z1S6_9PROT|nr:tol-pal system-associated acyl-CoA thioesterase [Acidisoma cellulosilyticum]MCB8880295.1 tol-pal system-associated acyl-CoA thioesterase [Acidisoma cellulosilyticum]